MGVEGCAQLGSISLCQMFNLGYPPHDEVSLRPGYRGTSLQRFFALFPDDDACLFHVFRSRFGVEPICPGCGRASRWYRISSVKCFKHSCGHQISPLAGTVFSRSSTQLSLWFYAMLHFANSTEGVSLNFLSRHLGLSRKCAYRMAHRIRLHLAAFDFGRKVGGGGQEIYVRIDRLRKIRTRRKSQLNAATIFLLADRDHVQATVIEEIRRHQLNRILADKAAPSSKFVTDCYLTYRALSEYGTRRPLATFHALLEGRALESEKRAHGFLASFRKPLDTQHRWVTREKLWVYLKEYEFRFNRREASETIFWSMVSSFPQITPKQIDELTAWNWRPNTRDRTLLP